MAKRNLTTDEGLDAACRRSNYRARRLRLLGIGGCVKPTREAVAAGAVGVATAGVIVGFGSHWWTVRVRPSHRRTSSAYHVDFWMPDASRKQAVAKDGRGKTSGS